MTYMKLKTCVLSILIFVSTVAIANEDKIDKWIQLANAGDHKAQANLGYVYLNGWKGIPQNYKKALIWYKKAAEGNIAGAQNNLGHMYEHGLGVRKNLEEAINWYRQAAKQNDSFGQYNAGILLLEKIATTPEHRREGLKYLIKAKESGNFHAEFIIGKTYIIHNLKVAKGPQNLNEAVLWIKNSANKGSTKAIEYLIFLYKGNQYGIPASKKERSKWQQKLKGK